VAGTAANHVFPWQKTGFKNQVFNRSKKFTVKMGDILEEMRNQVPCRFLGFNIFLSADMAVFAINLRIAV
jgi:hypothetical protein